MAALHEALKSLGPLNIADTPVDDLKPFLTDAFRNGQLLVDSVPISGAPDAAASPEGRSRASSTASSASEISPSHARSDPPPGEVEALQKEWKTVKLNAKDNPLGMSVYKLGGKDGKGSWFARRSVHEGLGFTKWKKGLEREFPETLKVQGGPGEGNIRGIGGERRVEYLNAEGVGKVEVYLLSAQFPGPTAPRDFVTMVITSDQALSDTSGGDEDVPRHFMVISKPCIHPDAPQREGYIRGQYESVEFIREIPIHKAPKKSASTTNLPVTRKRAASTLSRDAILRNAKQSHSSLNGESETTAANDVTSSGNQESKGETRARGKTISFDMSRGSDAKGEKVDVPHEDDESECNPIEWIMITRSDPGGSVPRFLIDRGTPAGIVSDASKFLDWACAKDMAELECDDGSHLDGSSDMDETTQSHQRQKHDHQRDLHDYQTNGHLVGIEEATTPVTEKSKSHAMLETHQSDQSQVNGGLYGMVAGVAGAAGEFIAAHTPTVISNNLPHAAEETKTDGLRRDSFSSISSDSSIGSFASALENYGENDNDASSSRSAESSAQKKATALQDRELQKLEEKKRKLDEKLSRTREKELSKKSDDSTKEEEAIRRAEERHEREKKKQEEKYKREVEKLERKKEKEERKAEERRRKAADKDAKSKLLREMEELKVEVSILKKEKEILRVQVGDLQAENTSLAARVGRLGPQGEEVLRDVRAEVGRTGRLRASSLKGLTRSPSFRSSSSGEKSVVETTGPGVTVIS